MPGYSTTVSTSSLPSGWVVARSSTGTYFDSSGVLQTANSNVGRITYDPISLGLQGLLLEPAATNDLRNNTMAGASAPSTLPTRWSRGGGGGITSTVVGTGTVNGMNYMDLRLSGTTSGTVLNINMDTLNGIAAANGQIWSLSNRIQIVGGSTSNISSFVQLVQILDSGGGILSEITGSFTPTSSMVWYLVNGTISSSTAAFVRPIIRMTYSNGVAIDITLRIALPQLTQTSADCSLIKTSGSAATRAAETLTVNGLNSYGLANGQNYPATIAYEDGSLGFSNITVSSGAVNFTGSGFKAIKSLGIYAPSVDRPTPTGTVYTVSTSDSNAAIKLAYDGCASGDCLEFEPGIYDADAIFTNGFDNDGVIVRAASIGSYDSDPFGGSSGTHWARFSRNVIFEYSTLGANGSTKTANVITASDLVIHDIHFRLSSGVWPSDGNNYVNTLGANYYARCGFLVPYASATRYKILYCEFSTGYGTNRDPFDPSIGNVYYDYTAPSGDNRLLDGPVALDGRYNKGEGCTIYANYVHDMTGGFHNVMPGSGTILIQHNWGDRLYHDFCNMLGQTTHTTIPSSFLFEQNICVDPFADSSDTNNPHQDMNQLQFQNTSGGAQFYIRGIRSSRNFVFSNETTRGTGIQVNFNPLVANDLISTVKPVSQGAKYRENLSVMSGTSHALDTGVCEHPYIRGNLSLHLPGLDTTPSRTRFTWLKTNGYASAAVNKAYVGGNIVENTSVGQIEFYSENNFDIGSVTSRKIDDSDIFQGDLSTYPTTLTTAFNALKTKGIFGEAGCPAPHIRDHILGPLDWTGEVPFCGWVAQKNVTASSTITSEMSWVHGGDTGDSHTITPGTGLEIRTLLESDRSTVVQTWTSSAIANVQTDNHVVQARGTSAAADGAVRFEYDINGVDYTWDISTAYTPFATASFDATGAVAQPSNASIASDSSFITIGLELAINTGLASAKDIFHTVSGSGTFRIQILSDETLRLNFYNSSGTEICRFVTGQSLPTNGTPVRFLMSVDMTQSIGDNAVTVYMDGDLDNNIDVQLFTSGQSIGFSRSVRRKLGGSTAFDFGFIHVVPTIVDLSDPVQRAKYNANNIGSDGSGVTGSQPPIFMWGDVTKLNSANANYGSVTFAKLANSIS